VGSWGVLCAFDRAKFLAEIVPALRAGEYHPLIAEEIQRSQKHTYWKLPAMRGLDVVMDTFDAELNVSSLEKNFTAPAGWTYEELCVLFESLLTRYCMTAFTIVGRRYAAWMTLRCEEDGDVLGGTDESNALVQALDERWAWWTTGNGGYFEGLNGWLDADETVRFASALEHLRPAPEMYEPEWWAERVGKIRYLVERARLDGVGLLWGGDLRIAYDRSPHSIPEL